MGAAVEGGAELHRQLPSEAGVGATAWAGLARDTLVSPGVVLYDCTRSPAGPGWGGFGGAQARKTRPAGLPATRSLATAPFSPAGVGGLHTGVCLSPPNSVLGPLEAPPAPGPAWLCAAALHLELRQAGKAGLRSELARLPCPGDEARTTGTGSGF